MVTVHFNGDVVHSANMKKIAEERQIKNDQNRKCIYGRSELTCDTWRQYCLDQPEVKRISDFGRCILKQCDKCPLYRMRKEAGERIKKFRITSQDYRKMSSGAHWLIKTNRNKVLFFTLTFPPTHKKHKYLLNTYLDEHSNEFFSRFMENLKEHYHCSGYIAVKEHGTENNRLHFHVLANMPFTDLRLLNSVWCNTIKTICKYSPCALQTDAKNRIIRGDINRAIRYICKYFSKAKRSGGESYTRLIFITHNLLHKKIAIDDLHPQSVLSGYKGIYINKLDFVTIFRITDNESFKKFCEVFIYDLFSDRIKTEIEQNTA